MLSVCSCHTGDSVLDKAFWMLPSLFRAGDLLSTVHKVTKVDVFVAAHTVMACPLYAAGRVRCVQRAWQASTAYELSGWSSNCGKVQPPVLRWSAL